MNSRTTEQVDRKTSRSICDAMGEGLQQNLRPVKSVLPSHLEHLMDELKRQDDGGHRISSNQGEYFVISGAQRACFAQKTGCVWRRLR